MNKTVAVIGSGIAGVTASIYLARAGIRTIMYTGDVVGGALTYATAIENYTGFPTLVTGMDLMTHSLTQAEMLGVEIVEDTVTKCSNITNDNSTVGYSIELESGESLVVDGVIIAVGAKPKKLGLENESKFLGNGVHYCALCDGAFYKDKEVAIVGGGETAMQEAAYLSGICKKVYILVRKDKCRACDSAVYKACQHPNVKIMFNTSIKELVGDDSLSHVILNDDSRLDVSAVFVAIGHKTDLSFLDDPIKYWYTDGGYESPTYRFAGDCNDVKGHFRQAIVAAGDGATQALSLIEEFNTRG